MGMRPGIGIPTMSKRAKRVLIVVVSLVVLAILWFQFVGLYVDFLWYGEVGFRQVFTTQAINRIVLFLVAGLGAGGLIFLAMMFAYRSRPVFVPTGDTNDPLAPYRTAVSSRPRVFAIGISALIGLICGLSAQGQWTTVQLFLHGGSFGQPDPQFGHDVGFYVFRLPLIQMLLGWFFVITAICFIAVLAIQYVFGGIRLQGSGRKVTSAATLQVSLLIGVFVLIKAIQYWFDRYNLLFSDRSGIFTGASYTDVNAVLPAKIILMAIAAICAVGFIVGALLRSVKLPAIALGLLVLSSVLIGGVWPLILQQVVVKPNANTKESTYISKNIDATQRAFKIGSDNVETIEYSGTTAAQAINTIGADKNTIPNARLLDPNVLSSTFTQQQQLKNFYGFPNQLSVDRYSVDGQVRDYVVAARELYTEGLFDNQKSWINEHLIYTHGNGFVAAPANSVTNASGSIGGGYPEYTVSDLENKGKIPVEQPRIYYGQLGTTYAIVGQDAGRDPQEFDTDASKFTYNGKGGVHLGNLFQRLVFATEYGEANFLFSNAIGDNSRILYNRDPGERVKLAAPFLTVDTKPYPAVVKGRIVWIVDGYTTVQNFPYSQNVTLSEATANSLQSRGASGQADEQVSYIRNSVKATVDAYDGSINLFTVDDKDPVLQAWKGVFPGLVKENSAIPTELRDHFRYPQDLFEVQRTLLAKYHVANSAEFYNQSNFWRVPNDPTIDTVSAPQPPYYLLAGLPKQTGASFQLTSVLTGYQRNFMSSYLSAASDPANYGKLTVLQLPTTTQTLGPVQVQQLFKTTSRIAQQINLLSVNNNNTVIYGNLLTLPVNDGLLYVEPVYVEGRNNASSFPQLAKVLVWFAGRVGFGDSLSEALADAAASAPVEPPTGEGGDPGATGTAPPGSTDAGQLPSGSTNQPPSSNAPLPANQQEAAAAMDQAYTELQAAKKSGDQAEIGAANKKLEQAVEAYLQVATSASPSSGSGGAPVSVGPPTSPAGTAPATSGGP